MRKQFNKIKNLQVKYRNPKKILLFRIPTINYSSFDIKSQKRSGYGTYQPLSLTTLAANLIKRTDKEIKCVDLEFESLKLIFLRNRIGNILEELTKKYLLEFSPDIIGLSVVFSPAMKNGFKVAEISKELLPKSMIVFGGVHCTFDYKTILDKSVADAVFLNEADDTLPEFIEFLSAKRSESDIHGIAFKVNNNIYAIPYKTYPDFQNLPMPAWDMVDTKNYYKVTRVCGLKNIIEDVAPSAIINTVRGCVAKCTFCSVRNFNGFGVRARSPEDVLDELEILVKDYGIKYVEVVDDDFTADLEHALTICKGIINRKLDIIWSLDNGIRLLTITEELAEYLVESRCGLISVGVESGNEEIMRQVKKPLTIQGLYKKMEMMKKFPEIYIKGNFIVGFPFEKYNQLLDTYRVANELEFDWKIFSIYSPLIGTDALNYYDEETRDDIKYSENYYGKGEILPKGYKNMDDFINEVYFNNLKSNFIENPNFLGKRGGHDRAIKDFKRIIEQNDPDHAIAHFCLSKLYHKKNDILSVKHKNKYLRNKNKSEKWQYFCKILKLPQTENDLNKSYVFDDFRSGREIDGERFV